MTVFATLSAAHTAAHTAGHKFLAKRLVQEVRTCVPASPLSHVQALHIVAALYGLPNWQTLEARPTQPRLAELAAQPAVQAALEARNVPDARRLSMHLITVKTPVTASVLNEEISDGSLKTQIELALLLTGHLTPEGIHTVLEEEFHRQTQRTGFRFHSRLTSIYIWAFASEAHYASGAGQIIGMVNRSSADLQEGKAPEFSIYSDRIDAFQTPANTSFGLSESTRRTIFLDHCRVTNRARLAADQRYPTDQKVTREVIRSNQEYKHKRLMEWDHQIAEKHGLSETNYHDIIVEAMVRDWPMATLSDTQTQTIP
ncbi:hypothetical protein [Deinococcus sp. QL22]|uniref:hypothetical protein n=1 Tax=Deinococcus sp. QL22 TaxID=2939437 RepID=UPI0020170D14|nr:hypothetical protein [Deinococcus sp. QL22]UQN10829.1 hypothetical protein M1R55_31670 [Deinococcus sp. QL22]